MANRSRSPKLTRGRKRDRSVETDASTISAPALPEPTQVVTETCVPKYNLAFMGKLMNLEAMRTARWGDIPFADVFEAMVTRSTPYKDSWIECQLATRCGEKLRLVPQDWSLAGRPAYSMPKLIRYAALLGSGHCELDLVSSHPRQILRYALLHNLGHTVLQAAFGSRQAIAEFRTSTAAALGLQVSDIKLATNMICYGSALREWMAERGIQTFPPILAALKSEVAAVRDHYWGSCPDDIRAACLKYKHPNLTALSVMCQIGEREDLDRCVEELPQTVILMGYLNDSFLCDRAFDGLDAYIERLEGMGILIEEKPLPSTEEAYRRLFLAKTGIDLEGSAQVSELEARRRKARAVARAFLFGKTEFKYTPDLDIVLGISDKLPVNFNPVTNCVEFYDEHKGRWIDNGKSSVTLELLSKVLLDTYYPVALESVQQDGKMKLVPVKAAWDHSKFRNTRFINSLRDAAQSTSSDYEPLDWRVDEIINFDGPVCMDFSKRNPEPTEFTDSLAQGLDGTLEEIILLKTILAPVRATTRHDRNTRHMPHRWELYPKWREMLKLVPLLQQAEVEQGRIQEAIIRKSDDEDELDLTPELKEAILAESVKHTCLHKLYMEPFQDMREALYSLKISTNAINGKSRHRTEHYTGLDDGEGATCKGTQNEHEQRYLGYHDGNTHLGYATNITLSVLIVNTRPGEAPSEQLANLAGCRIATSDDFKADDKRPIDLATLHRLTGNNSLTAARKHKGERPLYFRGVLKMLSNTMWTPCGDPQGCDLRRAAGQYFDRHLRDYPDPEKGDLAKDPSVKENVCSYRSEFTMLILIYFHIQQCMEKSEQTLPQPPSCRRFVGNFMRTCLNIDAIIEGFLPKLVPYVPSLANPKPPSPSEIYAAVQEYAKREWKQTVTIHGVQEAFNKLQGYKVVQNWSYPIPGRLGRAAVNAMRRTTGRMTVKGEEYETVMVAERTWEG